MTAAIVLLSILLFCAMILNLAAKPRFTRGLIGACTLISALGGLVLYGIGYYCLPISPTQQIFRTVLSVCRMFAGINEYSVISAAPIFEHDIWQTAFWLVHLMAFYATASATISTLGAAALKRLKFWLQRYGSSVIIYGISEDTVAFGRSLIASGVHNVIYVGNKPDATCEGAINAAGALVRSDISALNPDRKFLKSLGSEKGSPDLTLYALDTNANQNLAYAAALLGALEACSVDTTRVRLVMRSSDDSVESGLTRSKERYGYGDVKNFTDTSLSARLLMQSMPPCDKMTFRDDCTAQGDFDAIIVGFGKTGQSVLRYLTRNAQFAGSHYCVSVFSPNYENEIGHFCSSYPGMMEQYDIRFQNVDARSRAFYSYIRDRLASLRYVVVCTGNQRRDNEISSEISAYLKQISCDAAVCQCSSKSVAWCVHPGTPFQYRSVYEAAVLGSDACDRMAMMLNYSYVNDKQITPQQAWADCDYFSRESSRASADFIRAFLRIAGTTEQTLDAQSWPEKSPAQLENLGITEHLRWCAFHYSMGFESMPEDVLHARGKQYRAQMEANGRATIRITKDLPHRMHACLCTWEELDTLSTIEEQYTGKYTDYKDMDVRNVLALPHVLQAVKELDL
ncbi:MAG: hypothetical protein PUD38_08745 [Firmicutes bacterium]|nr:hypothetical protein [Bacillota bacterium]